jgi:hypothetical protein
MTREKLSEMALKEVKHIKKVATQEEIARLDFTTFKHDSVHTCIYGQMTGYCDSERARGIARRSLNTYWENGMIILENISDSQERYTPLELYLYICGKYAQKRIIKFLKGEQKSITLK